MITIKIQDFDIRISESTFSWSIFVEHQPITSGQGTSVDDARKRALKELENYLDRVKSGILLAGMQHFEGPSVRAFRWYRSSSFKGIVYDGLTYYYHEYVVKEGNWIFPDEQIVMHDDMFQKLFKRSI